MFGIPEEVIGYERDSTIGDASLLNISGEYTMYLLVFVHQEGLDEVSLLDFKLIKSYDIIRERDFEHPAIIESLDRREGKDTPNIQ